MSDQALSVRFGLNLSKPLSENWQGFSLIESSPLLLLWLSASAGQLDRLEAACQKSLGCGLPDANRFQTHEKDGLSSTIAYAGQRQWLIIKSNGDQDPAPCSDSGPVPGLSTDPLLAKSGNLTDVSDGLVAIAAAGKQARSVLEKLCPVDLHPSAFPSGATARTVMEAMNVQLLCRDSAKPSFDLIIARSSARSFVDHLRHAAYSTCGERIQDPH